MGLNTYILWTPSYRSACHSLAKHLKALCKCESQHEKKWFCSSRLIWRNYDAEWVIHVSFSDKEIVSAEIKKYISLLQGIEPWSPVRQTIILPLYYSSLGILVPVFICFRSKGYWTRHFWEMLVWKVWPCHNQSQQHTLLFWFSHRFVVQSYSEIGGSSLSVFISISNWFYFVGASTGIPYSAIHSSQYSADECRV
jgi:hypothetical protein